MNKKIVIVNEKDEIIGNKLRNEIKSKDVYRVSALWITNSKKEILLAQRAFTKKNDPGKWTTAVAGTIEEGESYDSNIIKEAKEELRLYNIKPQKGQKIRVYGEHNFFCQWYTLVLDKPLEYFVFSKEEVRSIKWFTPKALAKEVEKNPDNFLPSMKQWIDLFC